MNVVPPWLKFGDRIRIVSPAGKVLPEKVNPGIEMLRQSGFEVLVGKYVYDDFYQYAGTDEQRAADLQQAINDPLTKAIICARGGYGSVRLIDLVKFSAIVSHPKWLVGFSDITVLHIILNKLGLCSLHAAMPGFYQQNGQTSDSFTKMVEVLSGRSVSFEFDEHSLNLTGSVSGELTGGNLSLLYSLAGTPYDLDTDGKILFIEDISEYLYHLDRMMMNLKLAGKLKNLKGLLIGSFTEMKNNETTFGKTTEEIIFDAVKDYSFPVCFGFPAGHIDHNMPLVLGAGYRLEVGAICKLSML